MRARSWYLGIVVGLLTGLLVALAMTLADWWLNPSGIFHNEQGTNWTFVTETAISWFWPVALVVCVATVITNSLITRVREKSFAIHASTRDDL